jgi:hypothetical protein
MIDSPQWTSTSFFTPHDIFAFNNLLSGRTRFGPITATPPELGPPWAWNRQWRVAGSPRATWRSGSGCCSIGRRADADYGAAARPDLRWWCDTVSGRSFLSCLSDRTRWCGSGGRSRSTGHRFYSTDHRRCARARSIRRRHPHGIRRRGALGRGEGRIIWRRFTRLFTLQHPNAKSNPLVGQCHQR